MIPARLGSERLPRKPLQSLGGRPLIEWVWRRVSQFKTAAHVVIATDSEEVAGVCYAFGADVAMTRESHRSGTERVAEVVAHESYRDYDVVVNVQGDEPFILEEHVAGAVSMVLAGFDVGTVGAPVRSLEAYQDSGVVKIARAEDGRAWYFSRAPIPYKRGATPAQSELESAAFLRHIGVYAYTPAALAKWVALPETALEHIEKLEQLRPLAAGMSIGVALVEHGSIGIDTAHDLAAAEAHLKGS
ncbi:MAG TPA: 3-deoxy-manno-octulosonate cytidylyltransferase [Longimicrobiales bacterium]